MLKEWWGRWCGKLHKRDAFVPLPTPAPEPEKKEPRQSCYFYGLHKPTYGEPREIELKGEKLWVQLGTCFSCGISEWREVLVASDKK